MESDGLLIATPIISRTIIGKLKLVADRLSGPASDVAFAENYRRLLEAGETPPVAFPYDERVFRPRVAGFIAVGGALTDQWKSLALPLMHQITFSAHMAVADQMVAGGAGMPRSIVLDEHALAAAARVGHSVGTQLGAPFEQVQYRGEPGLCPLCHLSVLVVAGEHVQCATCGAGGRLVVEGGGPVVRFDDPAALQRSVATMAEKRAHFAEVMETAAEQGPQAQEIERRAAPYAGFDRRITPSSAAPGDDVAEHVGHRDPAVRIGERPDRLAQRGSRRRLARRLDRHRPAARGQYRTDRPVDIVMSPGQRDFAALDGLEAGLGDQALETAG